MWVQIFYILGGVVVCGEEREMTNSIRCGPFETFEEAYKLLIKTPKQKQIKEKHIEGIKIWWGGQPLVNVCPCGGFEIIVDDLQKLDVAEDEFDKILEKIEQEDADIRLCA